jgi:peptidoglycan-associated lipoprotein
MGLLLGSAACSHQQPVATETVKPLPGRSARAEAPRPRPGDENLTRRDDTASAPTEPAIFFDLDSAELRGEDQTVLQHLADDFRARGPSHPRQIRIEGNCDDLGTAEYNLALGEHRARAAKTYLIHLGVPDNRIATISYGSGRPKYPDDDSGRAKNRRDDLVIR